MKHKYSHLSEYHTSGLLHPSQQCCLQSLTKHFSASLATNNLFLLNVKSIIYVLMANNKLVWYQMLQKNIIHYSVHLKMNRMCSLVFNEKRLNCSVQGDMTTTNDKSTVVHQ